MRSEYSNNTSSKTSVIIGGIVGIIGVGLMFISGLLGLILIILAVVLFFLILYFGSDTTVICHESGFMVRVTNKKKETSMELYNWQDVTETTYYELDSGGENGTTTSYFKAETAKGMAFNLYEMKNFHELILIFNQKTAHLPYIWEKPKGVQNTSYIKQNRSSS